jgi:predicted transcriptional regulator of viral defense system
MNSPHHKQGSRGRPSKRAEQLDLLLPLGIFHLQQAIQAGVPRESLSRLVKDGFIFRLEQDLYRHPEADIDPAIEDFAVACKKFGPESAIGGPTALFHYHLIDQPPAQIWVLVPPIKISRSRRYRCIRTKTSLVTGIEDHQLYRMTSMERAIVEAFRYATKFGLEIAIKSAHTAIRQQLTTPAKIAKQARDLDLESYITRNWEILTTG